MLDSTYCYNFCSCSHGTLSLLPNATNLITINSFGETVLFY